MADIHYTFNLNLHGSPTVQHHVEQSDNRHSWRIDDASVYLTGTVDELRAFGDAVLEAAAAQDAKDELQEVK